MEQNQENQEPNDKDEINEKVKNKLKEFTELKCLYNLSNGALRFKRNISLIIQERVEKNLNLNPKKNNYYTAQSPSTDVYNIKSIINNVFGDYMKSHNINLEEEVKKFEKIQEEKKDPKNRNKKPLGSEMQKKFMTRKEQQENNEKTNKRKIPLEPIAIAPHSQSHTIK